MNKNKQTRTRGLILATLGAELGRLNIGYEHRDTLRGVLEMPVEDFCAAISTIDIDESRTVGKVLAWLVTSDLGPFAEFGTAALHRRREDAYDADCASWQAQPASVKNGVWRRQTPSRGQRMLMIRMAQTLNVPLPGDVSKGEAAEWIAKHGGNPNYRKER